MRRGSVAEPVFDSDAVFVASLCELVRAAADTDEFVGGGTATQAALSAPTATVRWWSVHIGVVYMFQHQF